MLWLPLLLWLFGTAEGQPSHYAVAPTAGNIIATNGSPFYGKSATLGLDIAAFWQRTDSTLFWEQYWDYPLMGVRANYAHINNSPAGDRLAVAATLQGTLVGSLDWTFSTGLSFYTRPYSVSHDPANIYIGSAINCLIDLGLVYNRPLTDRLTLFLVGKLVHSSNGYLYKPNRGLNFLQLETGLRLGQRQHLNTARHLRTDTTFTPHSRPFLMVAPAAVMSRYDPLDQLSLYPAYTLQLGYLRHAHPCFAYGAALDLSYNFSHRRMAPAGEWPLYPALSLFTDTRFGPLVLRTGIAHYLAYYPLNWEQYYERVGLYYRFGSRDRQMAGVGMKVHYDHIDFIEWTYILEL